LRNQTEAAEVSRSHSTFAVEEGRPEHEGGRKLSSSRVDRRKQNTLDKRTTGQTKEVKLPGAEQRAEVTPARDKEQASTELWEIIFERENLLTA